MQKSQCLDIDIIGLLIADSISKYGQSLETLQYRRNKKFDIFTYVNVKNPRSTFTISVLILLGRNYADRA